MRLLRKPEEWLARDLQIAKIILRDPGRYAGLPLRWARTLAQRHDLASVPDLQKSEWPSFEERLRAAEEKRDRCRLRARRRRWKWRQWTESAAGNYFCRVAKFHIVVYAHNSGWSVRIEDKKTGQVEYSRRSYVDSEAACDGAFDAWIWMERQREKHYACPFD